MRDKANRLKAGNTGNVQDVVEVESTCRIWCALPGFVDRNEENRRTQTYTTPRRRDVAWRTHASGGRQLTEELYALVVKGPDISEDVCHVKARGRMAQMDALHLRQLKKFSQQLFIDCPVMACWMLEAGETPTVSEVAY